MVIGLTIPKVTICQQAISASINGNSSLTSIKDLFMLQYYYSYVYIYFSRFAGNKCVKRDVPSKIRMGESSLFYCAERVIDFLVDIAPKHTRFPTAPEEKQALSSENFKRVIKKAFY